MAELVDYRLEKAINELDELEKVGLFDRNEIRLILKKREFFEYKVSKVTKSKDDYVKYIKYEECLLKLIKIRRNEMGCSKKYKEIDAAIGKRIGSLYKKVIYKYQEDTSLWFDLIAHYNRMKWTESISSLYTRMLQVHNKNPSIWVAAAKWNFGKVNSPELARKLFQRGLRFNKESGLLYKEYFRMELMYAEKIHKRRQTLQITDDDTNLPDGGFNDAVLSGKIALVVYKSAVKVIPGVEFACSLIEVVDEFDDFIELQNQLRKEFLEKYSDEEETWNFLAKEMTKKRESFIEEQKENDDLTEEEEVLLRKEYIDLVSDIYEKAVVKVKTEKMWSYYIQFMLESISRSSDAELRGNCITRMLNLCQMASDDNLLSSSLFIQWLLILNSKQGDDLTKQHLRRLIRIGLEKFKDVTVYYTCMSLKISMDSTLKDEIKKLFDRGLESFTKISQDVTQSESTTQSDSGESTDMTSKKSLNDLWELYIQWAAKTLKPKDVLALLEKVSTLNMPSYINAGREIASHFKPLLLDFAYEYRGITLVRAMYKKYKNNHPVTVTFFRKMAQLEEAHEETNVSIVRSSDNRLKKVYDDMTEHFGQDDHEIWLDYIKYVYKNEPQKAGHVYFQAKKSLNPTEFDKFMSSYSLMKTY